MKTKLSALALVLLISGALLASEFAKMNEVLPCRRASGESRYEAGHPRRNK